MPNRKIRTKLGWPDFTNSPYGIATNHTWRELGILLRAIDEFGVSLFIEIGVGKGGIASMLVQRCEFIPMCRYLGLTLDSTLLDRRLQKKNEELSNFCVFCGVYSSNSMKEKVSELIEKSSVCMIYCNGSDKIKEFTTMLPLLRPGDILASFDYPDMQSIKQLIEDEKFEKFPYKWASGTRILIGRIL